MHDETRLTKLIQASAGREETEIFLLQLKGPRIGSRVFLAEGETVFGRSDSCTVVLGVESVSRRHCSIRVEGGEVRILDLGSTNGTWLNGRRLPVDEPTRIEMGDRLEIGEVVYKLLREGDVEAAYLEELRRLAITDVLTGAYNRRYLIEHLEKEVVRCLRHRRPLSLLLFDVDHFKRLNDTYGHLAGDRILEELSARIRLRFLRKADVFARYGGEEFVVVLTETDARQANAAAERLRALVADEPFLVEGAKVSVTVSIGLASLDEETSSTGALLARADENLYRAKRGGRNRVGH